MGWEEEIMQSAIRQVRLNMRYAVDEAKKMILARTKRGEGERDKYSKYSRSHAYRREKEGLQTANKDLWFSGTMLNSMKEHWTEQPDQIRVDIEFSGQAYRREDQKDNPSNQDIAVFFEKREKQNPLGLTQREKDRILETYLVIVDD